MSDLEQSNEIKEEVLVDENEKKEKTVEDLKSEKMIKEAQERWHGIFSDLYFKHENKDKSKTKKDFLSDSKQEGPLRAIKDFACHIVNEIFHWVAENSSHKHSGHENVSFGEKVVGFLLGICGGVSSTKFEVKLENQNPPEKIVIKTKEKAKELINNLKEDFICMQGATGNPIALAIQNATNSQLEHMQFLHYDENKSEHVVLQCAGVGATKGTMKVWWENILMKEWIYIVPICWDQLNKEEFQKIIYPWIKKLKDGEIIYDLANLFEDALSISMGKTINRLKKIKKKMGDFLIEVIDKIENIIKKIETKDCFHILKGIISLIIKMLERVRKLVGGCDQDISAMVCSEFVAYLLWIGKVLKHDVNFATISPQSLCEMKLYSGKYYAFDFPKKDHKFQTDDLKGFNTKLTGINYVKESKRSKEEIEEEKVEKIVAKKKKEGEKEEAVDSSKCCIVL